MSTPRSDLKGGPALQSVGRGRSAVAPPSPDRARPRRVHDFIVSVPHETRRTPNDMTFIGHNIGTSVPRASVSRTSVPRARAIIILLQVFC